MRGHTVPLVPTCELHYKKIHYFQYVDTNICPEMIRPMKHKHSNKNKTHRLQKQLFKLNAGQLTSLKNQLISHDLGVRLIPYLAKLYTVMCRMVSMTKITGSSLDDWIY
jgi:hypothetical protein